VKSGVVGKAAGLYDSHDRRALAADLDAAVQYTGRAARNGLLTSREWGKAVGEYFDTVPLLASGNCKDTMVYWLGQAAWEHYVERRTANLRSSLKENGRRRPQRAE
jgi:hypothetical protein